MQNIKAIIFDFGGVIFNIDFNKTCLAFNDIGVKDFADMYSLKNANPLFQHLEQGKISDDDFYITFRKLSNTELTDDQIKTALNILLLSYRKEALNTLKVIRHKYKLFLLSNTNNIHLQAFTKLYNEQIGEGSLNDYFDKAYYSHKTGYRKPAKEAYEMVLKENNLSASATLLIDDLIKNIEGAKALGLQTILLEDGVGIENLNL
jgi:putative hydrolase of the HAD superfamily